MIDRTTAYAKLVVSGKRLAGKTEFLCCKRHLGDLKNKDLEYIFDAKEAEKHINIANMLSIAEGYEMKPLVTRGFQNFIIGSIFGWRKKHSKERRYREAYVQIARQNGKSFLAGEISNDFCTFSGYQHGRIFCTATKQDQANIVWDEIRKFIESDEELTELYRIREHDRTIMSRLTGTVIKAIGRDTKSADGFRSILAVVDEYHAHPTEQMYKLMHDGQKRVDGALTFAITTAGFDTNVPCKAQYDFAKQVLSGVIKKDTLFIYICEMDEDDDIWDYHNWAKANPLNLWLNDTDLNMEMIARYAEDAIEAKEKGGNDLLNFMTKTLNVWVANGNTQYLDLDKWKSCESETSLADLQGQECYLGIDLSQGGDLTSLALVFRLPDEKYYVYSHSFMPELRLVEHEKSDNAPYRIWSRQGLLTLTSGAYGYKTDYKYITNHLKELIEKYDLKVIGCGYDPANASAYLADLEFLGIDLTSITQSARNLNDATVDFKQSVDAGQIIYDKNNSLLNWSAANAVTVSNSFGEIKVEKSKAGERIDPIYAVLDAWKVLFLNRDCGLNGNEEFDAWRQMMINVERR